MSKIPCALNNPIKFHCYICRTRGQLRSHTWHLATDGHVDGPVGESIRYITLNTDTIHRQKAYETCTILGNSALLSRCRTSQCIMPWVMTSQVMILHIRTRGRSQHHLNSDLRDRPHQWDINKRDLLTASMLPIRNNLQGHLRWVIKVADLWVESRVIFRGKNRRRLEDR